MHYGPNSCTEVFTCIHRTLASVFRRVVPYAQHIPSFSDTWGYNMALSAGSAAEVCARCCLSLQVGWLAVTEDKKERTNIGSGRRGGLG